MGSSPTSGSWQVVQRGQGADWKGRSELAVSRPRGVTVSTLDSESSDRGSNPREAFTCLHCSLDVIPLVLVYVR